MSKLKASGEPRGKGGGGCVIMITATFIIFTLTAWFDLPPIVAIIATLVIFGGILLLVMEKDG